MNQYNNYIRKEVITMQNFKSSNWSNLSYKEVQQTLANLHSKGDNEKTQSNIKIDVEFAPEDEY